jgi:hypothetical protein
MFGEIIDVCIVNVCLTLVVDILLVPSTRANKRIVTVMIYYRNYTL